jgi:hypothetical protein
MRENIAFNGEAIQRTKVSMIQWINDSMNQWLDNPMTQ